jgi:hypothetical protein
MDYQSVSREAKQCGLFSDAEVSYWYKSWNVAMAVMLSEREDAQESKELVSSRNLDKLEKRTSYYLQTGCDSPELLVKVGSMKRRLRLNGLALKQMLEGFDAAAVDLTRTTARGNLGGEVGEKSGEKMPLISSR